MILLAFGWLACWIFARAPWSYVLAGVVALVVLVLADFLRRERETLEVAGTVFTRDRGDGPEEYDLSELADASYDWGPYQGSVVILTRLDGRSLEFAVARSAR